MLASPAWDAAIDDWIISGRRPVARAEVYAYWRWCFDTAAHRAVDTEREQAEREAKRHLSDGSVIGTPAEIAAYRADRAKRIREGRPV